MKKKHNEHKYNSHSVAIPRSQSVAICLGVWVVFISFHSVCCCASSNFNGFSRKRVVAFFRRGFSSQNFLFAFLHNDLSVASINTDRSLFSIHSLKYWLNYMCVCADVCMIGVESRVVFVCIGLWFFIIKWPTPSEYPQRQMMTLSPLAIHQPPRAGCVFFFRLQNSNHSIIWHEIPGNNSVSTFYTMCRYNLLHNV